MVARCLEAAKLHVWPEVEPSRGISVNREHGVGTKGPVGSHCHNNPVRVTGGVAGDGRSTQKGFGGQGFLGEPDMQIALSIGSSGSSEQAFCRG